MAKRPISRVRDLTILLLLLLLVAAAAAYLGRLATEEISGYATVIDGDSLRLGGRDVRLRGIDAPEYGQICQDRQGKDFDCGERARQELNEIIGNSRLTCESSQLDQFGRNLALCFTEEVTISLNEMMVQAGWAVDYGAFPLIEQVARSEGRGLWAGRFETPRSFRASRGNATSLSWWSRILGRGGADD